MREQERRPFVSRFEQYMANVKTNHVPKTDKLMADSATEETLDQYLKDYNKRFDKMLTRAGGSFPVYGVCYLVHHN